MRGDAQVAELNKITGMPSFFGARSKAPIYLIISQKYYHDQQYVQAVDAINKALPFSNKEDSRHLRFQLIECLIRLGKDPQNEIDALFKNIEGSSPNVQAQLLKGKLYLLDYCNNNAKAIDEFKKGITIYDNLPIQDKVANGSHIGLIYYHLSYEYMHLSRVDYALSFAEKGIEKSITGDNLAQIYSMAGFYARTLGDLVKSEKYLLRGNEFTARTNQNKARFLAGLAMTALELGDLPLARKQIATAVELYPNDPNIMAQASQVALLTMTGLYQEALEILTRIQTEAWFVNTDVEIKYIVYFRQTNILIEMGDRDQAIASYNLIPTPKSPLNTIGMQCLNARLSVLKKDPDAVVAIDHAYNLVIDKSNCPSSVWKYMNLLALASIEIGDGNKTLILAKWLFDNMKTPLDIVTTYYAYGEAYRLIGDKPFAIKSYERCIAANIGTHIEIKAKERLLALNA